MSVWVYHYYLLNYYYKIKYEASNFISSSVCYDNICCM